MNTVFMILAAVVLLTQIFAVVIIKSLEHRVRAINLTEKIGEAHVDHAKKCSTF